MMAFRTVLHRCYPNAGDDDIHERRKYYIFKWTTKFSVNISGNNVFLNWKLYLLCSMYLYQSVRITVLIWEIGKEIWGEYAHTWNMWVRHEMCSVWQETDNMWTLDWLLIFVMILFGLLLCGNESLQHSRGYRQGTCMSKLKSRNLLYSPVGLLYVIFVVSVGNLLMKVDSIFSS